MANVKLSDLPTVVTLADTDLVPVVASGVTSTITKANLNSTSAVGTLALSAIDSNYLECKDQVLAKSAYPTLATQIGDKVPYTLTQNLMTLPGDCTYVTRLNGIFFAAGTCGIFSSTDGISWTQGEYPGVIPAVTAIAYSAFSGGMYIAVGGPLSILKSTNGTTWTTTDISKLQGGLFPFAKVATNGSGIWVATGGAYMAVSIDNGASWDSAYATAVSTTPAYGQVIFANSLFVLLAANSVFTSTDGVTWTLRLTLTVAPTAVNYTSTSGGTFILVATNFIYSSIDGISWVQRSVIAATWRSVEYNTTIGLWVAVGTAGLCASSNNYSGTTWTAAVLPATYAGSQIINHGALFVVGCSGTTFNLMTSIDGLNWIGRNANNANAIVGLASSGTTLVLASNGYIYTSTTLTTGSAASPGKTGLYITKLSASGIISDTATDGTNFVVVGSDGYIATSTDGVTWTPIYSGTQNNLTYVTYGNSKFVAAGALSTCLVSSNAGVTWTIGTQATVNYGGTSIASDGTNFVVVSSTTGAGSMQYSTDGVTWRPIILDYFNFIAKYVAYANNLWVAVGSNGAAGVLGQMIMTSADGQVWTARYLGTTGGSLTYVAYLNSKWIAVGTAIASIGTIVTSANGTTWTAVATTNAGNTSLVSAATDGTTWVVVGTGGKIVTSTDSTFVTWTLQTSGTAQNLNSVVYANSLFVAVGAAGVILNSVNGTTWTLPTTATINSIAFDGVSTYVAVGTSGLILKSTDGTATWVIQTSGTAQNLNSVIFANSLFVAGGGAGVILTSPTGTTWTAATSNTTAAVSAIAYGNSTFTAVTTSGSNQIVTSTTGTGTWTSRLTVSSLSFVGVAYLNGIWIAYGNTSSTPSIYSPGSNDATATWTSRTTNMTGCTNITGLAFGNGAYVATGTNTTSAGSIIQSTNGTTWTQKATPATPLNGVTYGATFVVVGAAGTIQTSADGSIWAIPVTGLSFTLNSVTYSGSLYVTAGSGIATSSDAITWTQRSPNIGATTILICTVQYTNSSFLIFNSAGYIGKSTDGLSWTASFAPPTSALTSLIYANSLWVAIGTGQSIATSTSGTSQWITRSAQYATGILSYIAYGNSTFVAGGAAGLITSSDGLTWNLKNDLLGTSITAIIYANSLFVIVSLTANFTSTNGVKWYRRFGISATPTKLLYANSKFVLANGTITMSSSDGTTWTAGYSTGVSDTVAISSFDYGNGIWIGTTEAIVMGNIMTSSDAISWTPLFINGVAGPNAVVYGASGWVIIFQGGKVATSTDNTSWNINSLASQYSGTGTIWKIARYANGTYMLATVNQLFVSSDAATWKVYPYGFSALNYVNGAWIGLWVPGGSTSFGSDLKISYDNGSSWEVTQVLALPVDKTTFVYANSILLFSIGIFVFKGIAAYSSTTSFRIPKIQLSSGPALYIKAL